MPKDEQPGNALLPLLELALEVGQALSPVARARARDAFLEQVGKRKVSLEPIAQALLEEGAARDRVAGLCLFLARSAEVLPLAVTLPAFVEELAEDARAPLLTRFAEDVALLRQKPGAPRLGSATRELDQTHEPTDTVELGRLRVPEPATEAALLEVEGRLKGRLIPLDGEAEVLLIGRSREADLRVEEEGVSWEHAQLVKLGDRWSIVDAGSTNGVVVNGFGVEEHELDEGDRIQVGAVTTFKFLRLDPAELELQSDLARGLRSDPLTGVLNRRALSARLSAECAHHSRHARPFVVLRVDVDHLGQVNHERGPDVGDAAVVAVAKRLQDALREEDEVGRWSSQEFVCLLRDTHEQAGLLVAERIRQKVHASPVPGVEPALWISASIGVAVAASGGRYRPAGLISLAGDRVRLAKARGRNRVEPPGA